MIYGNKHVVFESVNVEIPDCQWNLLDNEDDENCVNNYSISYIRNTYLPSIVLKLSSVLQDLLTNTTIQTAKNGGSTTLVSTSDKLFLQAEKEVRTSSGYGNTTEFNALTTWQYWTSHLSSSDHIKTTPGGTAVQWRHRTPYYEGKDRVTICNANGGSGRSYTNYYSYAAPCFAW